ncbi:MAG: hypothetical protein Kilf2KO_16680 [Rhodospirillales bacterium]
MRTLLIALLILLWSAAASAELTSCSAVRAVDEKIEDVFKSLVKEYPGTVAFYGISGLMLKESNPQEIEEVIGGITAAFIACAIIIDTKSCDFVAGRIATLLSARAAVCVADRKYRCYVC